MTQSGRGRRGRTAWRAVALLVALAMVGVACGGDDDGDGGAEAEADPNGVLRIGSNLSVAGGAAIDPLKSNSVGDTTHLALMYGTPLEVGEDQGTYEPWLAERYEVVNPTTIELELRAGLTFQDGKPYDAATLAAGLAKNRDAKQPNFAPVLQELQTAEVSGATKLTLRLKKPVAGSFVEILAGREAMVPSPGSADPNVSPVGAGPYRFGSYERQVKLTMSKWDGFFEADDYQVASIEYIQVAVGTSTVNALLADQVDLVAVDPKTSEGVRGRDGYTLLSQISDSSFLYLGMCTTGAWPLFANEKFRQALNHAIDREEINDAVLLGEGEPMVGLWPKGSPFYDKSLEPVVKHDQAKARQLLKEAGAEGATFDAIVSNSTQNLQQFGEVVQGQLREIGLTMNLVPTTDIVADFFRGNKAPITPTLWIRPGLQKLTRAFGPNSTANICNYKSAEMDAIMAELETLAPDDPDAVKLWKDAQGIAVNDALAIYTVFQPLIVAYSSDRLAGVERIAGTSANTPGIDLEGVYVKK